MDKFVTISPHQPSGDSTGSVRLFYRDLGNGLPVILVHGFAEDGTTWDNQAAGLGSFCRLLIPDLPGSGRSPLLPGNCSIDGLADIINRLLDHLRIEKCIMIGHSMGGYITLAFAEKHPQRLIAFGLFHSTAYPDTEDKIAARRKSIEFIARNGSAAFIRSSTPNLFSAYTREHRPELVEAAINKWSGFSPDALVGYYEAMIARPDRTAVLRQFHGPILFIIGEDDTVVPLNLALGQCHLPAISHLHLVSHTGHQGMQESPQKCNEIIRDFLNFAQHFSLSLS